jgi:FkbM family methyltransferase
MKFKQAFYIIFYNPLVNYIARNIGRFLNKTLGLNIVFPVSGTVKYKGYDGREFKLTTNESSFVSHTTFWNGVGSYEYTDFFSRLSPRLGHFVDIGSNVGLYSVLAGIYNPKMVIYAFDPTEAAYEFTKKNLSLNNIANAHVFRLAVADHSAQMIFHEVLREKYSYLKHHLAGANSLIGDYVKGIEYKVDTISIDDMVGQGRIKNIDLIKIDAERAEPMILRGAKKSIERMKPVIMCEIRPDIYDEVVGLMVGIGYTIFHFMNGAFFELSSDTKPDYNWDHDFMFVPSEKLSLVRDLI